MASLTGDTRQERCQPHVSCAKVRGLLRLRSEYCSAESVPHTWPLWPRAADLWPPSIDTRNSHIDAQYAVYRKGTYTCNLHHLLDENNCSMWKHLIIAFWHFTKLWRKYLRQLGTLIACPICTSAISAIGEVLRTSIPISPWSQLV